MLRQTSNSTCDYFKRDSIPPPHTHKMVKLCQIIDMLHISSMVVITTQAYSYNMLNTLNISVFTGQS